MAVTLYYTRKKPFQMSKWADFVISAVKRSDELGKITEVRIHQDRGDDLGPPQIVDKHIVASDIKKGKKYITIFRKGENDWEPGEYVRTYVKDGESYIRTDDNKVNCDNLGTLPDIE